MAGSLICSISCSSNSQLVFHATSIIQDGRQVSFGVFFFYSSLLSSTIIRCWCVQRETYTYIYIHRSEHDQNARGLHTVHIQLGFGCSSFSEFERKKEKENKKKSIFMNAICLKWMILFHWCRSIRINVFRFANKIPVISE